MADDLPPGTRVELIGGKLAGLPGQVISFEDAKKLTKSFYTQVDVEVRPNPTGWAHLSALIFGRQFPFVEKIENLKVIPSDT